jgi:integrase
VGDDPAPVAAQPRQPSSGANIHPKVVQERLGHSGIGITMDLYSHLMPNMQSEAAAAVDVAMRAAINKRPDDVG